MTEGNSTTGWVDLLLIQTELLNTPDALGGKGLVDLVDVDIVFVDTGLLEGEWDGGPWTDTHKQWSDTDDGCADVLSEDLLTKLLSGRALHQENSGSSVRDLGCVTTVDRTILGESWLDLGEGLSGDTWADTVILGNSDLLPLVGLEVLELDLEWCDLLVEPASLLGRGGLLIRLCCESILLGTADATVLGHLLREITHSDGAVLSLWVSVQELAELGDSVWSVLQGHRLNTSTNADVNHAGRDCICNINAGLETRRALSVECANGGGIWKAGSESSSTELSCTTSWWENRADCNILDELWVDLGAVDESLEGTDQEVSGMGVLESSLSALGEWSAESAGYDDVIWVLGQKGGGTSWLEVVGNLADARLC